MLLRKCPGDAWVGTPIDLTSPKHESRMETNAYQAKLKGKYQFIKAQAADVAWYVIEDARNECPNLNFQIVNSAEGQDKHYPLVTFSLDQPTLHQVLDAIEAEGVKVEYTDNLIRLSHLPCRQIISPSLFSLWRRA